MSSAFNKGLIRKYNTFSASSDMTLTMEQSGSVLFLSSGPTITLPSVTDNAGANFKFINNGTDDSKITDGSTEVTLAQDKLAECICDGSKWHMLVLN